MRPLNLEVYAGYKREQTQHHQKHQCRHEEVGSSFVLSLDRPFLLLRFLLAVHGLFNLLLVVYLRLSIHILLLGVREALNKSLTVFLEVATGFPGNLEEHLQNLRLLLQYLTKQQVVGENEH